jgi:rhamnulose-1-phosphate aldolase
MENSFSPSLDSEISELIEAAGWLIEKSWAESFFGNISILIDRNDLNSSVIEKFPLPTGIPELIGMYILVTRTFSTMEEVVKHPETSIGLFEIEEEALHLLWGSGPPTSELSSHLMAYSTGRGRAIIHCHMDILNGKGSSILKEGPLPEGIGLVPKLEPGSMDLARATRDALLQNDTIIWREHGALSMGGTIEECSRRLESLEEYLRSIPP